MSTPLYKPTKGTAGVLRSDAERTEAAVAVLDEVHTAVEGVVLAAYRERQNRDAARAALRAESRATRSTR